MSEILQIHSDLKELLASLNDSQAAATPESYQTFYLHFWGLVVDATEQDEVYQQWAQQYLVDVDDESGEVVKLHESVEELRTDVEAFIHLVNRTQNS